jgi:AraC-like DNA-binding protein
VQYVSRVPQPPLDALIDDLYYLEGAPPYSTLKLPPMPSALVILNLGDPFRIGSGPSSVAEYSDGCVVTTPSRHFLFAYPTFTRSVGVHFKPWGLASFIRVPASELRDHPVAVEQVWGCSAAELCDRLDAAPGPHDKLALLEEELRKRLQETPGLGLVRHASGRIAATSGRVTIGALTEDAGVSSTHLAHRFKQLVGITPKRLARTYRFAAVVSAVDPTTPVDWGEVAGHAGYFDQPHFAKELQSFTGHTPTTYLELRRRFLLEHPGHALDVGPLPAD